MTDFKDLTPEAHERREQTLRSIDPLFKRMFECGVAKYSGHRCELMDGHKGPCKYMRMGTWYESK